MSLIKLLAFINLRDNKGKGQYEEDNMHPPRKQVNSLFSDLRYSRVNGSNKKASGNVFTLHYN